MNSRLFSIALLISALPFWASADLEKMNLNPGDFIAAERLSPEGETRVRLKLSKSGKAKFKKLNEDFVNKKVEIEIAEVESDFLLREPVTGDELEMGPYSQEEARLITKAINKD